MEESSSRLSASGGGYGGRAMGGLGSPVLYRERPLCVRALDFQQVQDQGTTLWEGGG